MAGAADTYHQATVTISGGVGAGDKVVGLEDWVIAPPLFTENAASIAFDDDLAKERLNVPLDSRGI